MQSLTTAIDPPAQPAADRRRWLILAVLCASVLVVVLDGTIVNVALPTLATQLGASTSQLQWIVDAYVLVFAGLLMAAGSFGDRVGRKWVLMGGLGLFATFSALGATSGSANALIAWRAAMGVGAALMFPATLAILVNVFTVAKERAVAIAVWAATAGLAVALGPVTGGWLLEHFWWGSVLMINVPVVIVALVLIGVFVPNSKDSTIARFDPLGTVLSIAAIVTLVWAVIEGPVHGWASPTSVAAFALAAALLAGFIAWERHTDHPMLDVSVFTNMRFTAGSISVTFAFFALMGFVFLVTQYFQFVRGYSTLGAGVRTVPFAVFTASTAPLSAKLAERIGTKLVVTAGLVSMAVGFAVSAVTGVEHVVLGDRRRDALPRRRPRPDPGPGHRGDHGLAAARQGGRRARRSTTPPASSAARSASPSSAACSRRSTPPRSAPRWPARPSRNRRSTSPRSRSAAPRSSPARPASKPARRPSRSSTTRSTTRSSTAGTPARGSASASSSSAPWSAWRWLPARDPRSDTGPSGSRAQRPGRSRGSRASAGLNPGPDAF